jgi:hypothetical protein
MVLVAHPEILLISDAKTVLLEMGREGKFSAKSAAWEENKVVLEGEELVIRVSAGRWFIVKRPARGAMIGPGTPAKTEAPAPETGDICNVVTGGVAPQPLRRNRLLRRSSRRRSFPCPRPPMGRGN